MKTILAGNIIINDKKEIYFLFRKKHQHYETPGGKYDGNAEKPSLTELNETAKRELLEEVKGVTKIKSMKHFITIEFKIPDGRDAIAHKFLTEIEGNPEPNEDIFDEQKSGWISKKELKTLKLAPDLEKIREELIKLIS